VPVRALIDELPTLEALIRDAVAQTRRLAQQRR
jgi:hypothetical protein